jgi:hypothetical protein
MGMRSQKKSRAPGFQRLDPRRGGWPGAVYSVVYCAGLALKMVGCRRPRRVGSRRVTVHRVCDA